MIRDGRFSDAISEAENARTANPADPQEAILLKAMAKVHSLDHRGALEDLDDIQEVFTNASFAESAVPA